MTGDFRNIFRLIKVCQIYLTEIVLKMSNKNVAFIGISEHNDRCNAARYL